MQRLENRGAKALLPPPTECLEREERLKTMTVSAQRGAIYDHPDTEEDETATFVKEPSIIEQKAYRDTWGRGLDSYLHWFYETLILLRELLVENGSIYVHLDWHVSHYAKVVLDDVFGYGNFRNEVVWLRTTAGKPAYNNLPRNFDTILWYSKGDDIVFSPQTTELTEDDKKTFNLDDKNGKGRYNTQPIINPAVRRNLQYVYTDLRGKKWTSPPNGWRFNKERMRQLESENRLYFTESTIREKYYLEERMAKGKQLPNVWFDIQNVQGQSKERVNYATQKPEALLERIIKSSSAEGDLVLDCFCGSGTTPAVAEKLGRRWVACDLGRFAIHTTRKRMLAIPNVKPFVVQNLGKYERQVWQASEFPDPQDRATQEKAYRNFILNLFRAEPVKGYNWLHGVKQKRIVHVGAVDAPVSNGDVKSIVQEFWKDVGKSSPILTNGIDILGWEFSFDINETARQQAASSKVDIKFKKIPREVLDKHAIEQGDVHFFELAGLDVRAQVKQKNVELVLKEFVIPPDDVPEDVRANVTHWSQWVDYWAVDWDYKEDTFHNEWQSYRTRNDPKIALKTEHMYEKAGKYSIVVKVIDILGNDTTKAISVEVS